MNRDEILGMVELTDGLSVATSGNYERYVELGGRRYTHIVDREPAGPWRAWPASP